MGIVRNRNWNWNNWNTQPVIIHLKSRISMRYDISKATAPAMSTVGKGTECIKLLLSQASKDMYEPCILMFFSLMAHTSVAWNFSISSSWKELFGQITLPYSLIGQAFGWITPSYRLGFCRYG